MSNETKSFDNLPGFKETIERLARVPFANAYAASENEHTYRVTDQTNNITYKIVSPRLLSAADVRRSLVRAFSRTDAWPDETGEVEIRI